MYKALMITVLLLSAMMFGCALQRENNIILSKPIDRPAEAEDVKYAPAKPSPPADITVDYEDRAIDIAKEFVMDLDGYKNQQGRDLQIINSAKSGCDGCWIIEVTFARNVLYYPDKTEHITVNVNLKDWKVSSYTFG
jgi:hypothetical protein